MGRPARSSADSCWLKSRKSSVLILWPRDSPPSDERRPVAPEVATEKTRKPSRSSLARRSRSAVASMVRVTISPVGVPIRQTYSAIGIEPDYDVRLQVTGLIVNWGIAKPSEILPQASRREPHKEACTFLALRLDTGLHARVAQLFQRKLTFHQRSPTSGRRMTTNSLRVSLSRRARKNGPRLGVTLPSLIR